VAIITKLENTKQVAFASTESDAGKAEKKATPLSSSRRGQKQNPLEKMADTLGVGLGPIAMSYQDDAEGERRQKVSRSHVDITIRYRCPSDNKEREKQALTVRLYCRAGVLRLVR